jgi:hypothetical protein
MQVFLAVILLGLFLLLTYRATAEPPFSAQIGVSATALAGSSRNDLHNQQLLEQITDSGQRGG